MNAVVLYDTVYGSTREIAEVIARVHAKRYRVQLVSAENYAEISERPDLLVVGSPTHKRRPTPAILTALRKIPDQVLDRVAAAAFCTRYNRPRFMTGAASLGIARRLNHRGARVEIGAESFYVVASDGPLVEGELERAQHWAEQVLYLVTPNPPPHY
jgi:flavodoxin